ncbi:hypothetical protein BOTBODRAFT_583292 [Botryobasidium botryosum FD-172 SS1]|uniref:Uncharacterized protein n=1 Tax=Botryobasidium botryosum (strain FD-172 SS1) TaxID=930990 RepID=A0A067N0X2_BOTB1|nr:hypothetical protein BOTBODRAFT_583292 [Botryobasidium botryosum FD-172 SS1]
MARALGVHFPFSALFYAWLPLFLVVLVPFFSRTLSFQLQVDSQLQLCTSGEKYMKFKLAESSQTQQKKGKS